MMLRALLLFLSPFSQGALDPSWVEVRAESGHLVVLTDAGDQAGRKVALQLAQFEGSLRKRFAWIKAENEARLLVFAFADPSLVRSMAPEGAEDANAFSAYFATASQQIGAIGAGLKEPSDKEPPPQLSFLRGRLRHLIEASLRTSPHWLSRGLVTFLADGVVKDKEIEVGRMTSDGGARLPALPAAEFFGEPPPANARFDLQSGFFIHYLLLGEKGKNAAVLDELLGKLAANAKAASLNATLARITSIYAGFPKYLASKKFSVLKLPMDAALSLSAFNARPLPLAEALMLRAEIFFEQNRPVDTRGLLRQAKVADPSLARPFEIEAVLFEREQRSAESKEAIVAAIERGSKNGSLYYRLAQLQWSRTMARPVLASVQKLLETARDLLPEDPSVLAYLAEIQSDEGLAEEALAHAERGAMTAPADLYAQMALARAQWNARQTVDAQATARKALALARVASQKQRVQEFLTFTNRNQRAQTKGGKPYVSQFGPPPAGAFGATRTVSGSGRVNVGSTQTGSADASAIAECFARRADAACARAVPALEMSCADKQGTSCVSLGSLFDGGFGVTRDRSKAAAAYRAACDLGEKAGCARLAVLEAQGLGVAQNSARALKTLETLCAEKIPEGCIGLAQILQRTGYRTDEIRARSLLKSTCAEGSAGACALLTGG
ncbi:MAG: hypothetical protein JJE39_17210 [Vicinamibacteria bacterium]|nr:hypothetical protein [Vicinamibacteria bacterium]